MIRTTGRGFAVYAEVTDTHGNDVRVQHSSSAEDPRVWIMCGHDVAGPAPHLDLAQARLIRAGLDEFIAAAEETYAHAGLAVLTEREQEIAFLIMDGKTNAQAGAGLGISKRTVDAHVDHIMDKLGVRSRTQIATWAMGHTRL